MATRISKRFFPFALLLAVACSDTAPTSPPATDRFYYPTGLAVRHVPAGCQPGDPSCQTQLLVASSNFDLRYDSTSGGTLIAVDVGAALQAAAANPQQAPQPLQTGNGLLGSTRIGPFAGEVAILDEETCPGWTSTLGNSPQALVTSRSQLKLYRVAIGAQGDLTCGADCQVPLEPTLGDPYGVTVACRANPSAPQPLAFVTYLRAVNNEGWLSQIDLSSAGSPRTQIDVGTVPTHSTVFDVPSTRLFVTEHFSTTSITPLRWLTLATPGTLVTRDIFPVVRGSEVRGMALSSEGAAASPPLSSEGAAASPPRPASRAYLALRLYDVDVANTAGARPSVDLAGALAVMDLATGPNGQVSGKMLNVVPIDRGATQIRVVPRIDPATKKQKLDPTGSRPLRDLLAITCTDDNTVALYDDESGSVAKVLDVCGALPGTAGPAPPPCDPGLPLTGKQPYGLAVEALANGHARLYVGSFDRSWVNVIEIDPLGPSAAPVAWTRIGPERL